MDNYPLVSVGILTYNSSKYIIEALESVKIQTYKKIELIVSDDCSKDNTVEICRKWLEENESRFVNTKLITVEKNTGTSANCNRRLAACKGEWLKGLAGDDALFPDCIENFINFVRHNPEAKCIVGNVREYKNTFDEKNVIDAKFAHFNINDKILEKSAEEQFRKLLINGNSFIPPAVFINIRVMRELGGYVEKYGILEDEPFYLKLLGAGYKIYGLNKDVTKYRSSDTNVWGSSEYLFNYKHQQIRFQWLKDVCFPYYNRRERIRAHSRFLTYWIMNKLGTRKNTPINRKLRSFLNVCFSFLTFDIRQQYLYFRAFLYRLKQVI